MRLTRKTDLGLPIRAQHVPSTQVGPPGYMSCLPLIFSRHSPTNPSEGRQRSGWTYFHAFSGQMASPPSRPGPLSFRDTRSCGVESLFRLPSCHSSRVGQARAP